MLQFMVFVCDDVKVSTLLRKVFFWQLNRAEHLPHRPGPLHPLISHLLPLLPNLLVSEKVMGSLHQNHVFRAYVDPEGAYISEEIRRKSVAPAFSPLLSWCWLTRSRIDGFSTAREALFVV